LIYRFIRRTAANYKRTAYFSLSVLANVASPEKLKLAWQFGPLTPEGVTTKQVYSKERE